MHLERGSGVLVAMRREVVTDYDGSGLQFRCENVPDICGERISIHCPFDHPRRDQAVMGQARNERLCAPCAEGGVHFQTLTAQAAPPQSGQVGFDRCFINEHKPVRMCAHRGDAVSEPILPQVLHTRAEPFGGDQRLFLYV